MGGELSHGEVVDLLGAYALDALDPVERQAVDQHLEGCQVCADEIVDHREVAGLLTPGWGKAPDGLWERIAASLEEVPPPLDLAQVRALRANDGARRRGAGAGPRRGIGMGIAAMVAVAAVAMVGFLGVRVADDRRQLRQFALGQHADELQRSANAAQADPEARKVTLVSADGYRNAQAVVLPDGTGYLVRSNLPALAKERTYQLWAIEGTSRISIGVLGPEPGIVPFKMDAAAVSALAITDETAGGVTSTSRDPVVVGKFV
ncbi:MAG TPA: anti-sigma factor [Acidimicrobiales bacterium]|jgi:anti-sigma factor RsiW|nr:anti-sigma factor [Acidimicrobiales bacterium]